MRQFSDLSDEMSAAEISITEGEMHQDTTTRRHKKHHKTKTSTLKNTHVDFTISLPLKRTIAACFGK